MIWSSMLPFLLRSTCDRQDAFCFSKAAILKFFLKEMLLVFETVGSDETFGAILRSRHLRKTNILLTIMLRRKPTRIELKGEDVEEFEKAKKMWTKDTKKEDEEVKAQNVLDDSLLALNDPKRISKIHERIGYKPETVPSDGTTTFHS